MDCFLPTIPNSQLKGSIPLPELYSIIWGTLYCENQMLIQIKMRRNFSPPVLDYQFSSHFKFTTYFQFAYTEVYPLTSAYGKKWRNSLCPVDLEQLPLLDRHLCSLRHSRIIHLINWLLPFQNPISIFEGHSHHKNPLPSYHLHYTLVAWKRAVRKKRYLKNNNQPWPLLKKH